MFEDLRKKVEGVFENGQKKMSKIENPKKVLKKTLEDEVCDDNAHNHRKNHSKNVTINFIIFFEKYLDIFSLETLWKLLETKFS